MSVRSVRTSLRLRAISGFPAFRRTGPSRWKIDAAWHSGSPGRDLVAGDLLDHEAVERLVAVQRVDHVVAIPPGVGDVAVVLVALGLGEADHVEPVLRPALAVTGAGEQPVDHALVGVRATCRRRTPRPPRASAASPVRSNVTRRIHSRRLGRRGGSPAALLRASPG